MIKSNKKAHTSKSKLIIRNAVLADIPIIRSVVTDVYGVEQMASYTSDMLRGQISNFPAGQFVAVFEDKIVGYCATFIISKEVALAPHTWREITGGGFASRHDSHGEYLYGMEVCILSSYRGHKIGQRFYNERKKLCVHKRLEGIVFGGRMPGFAAKKKLYPIPESYLEAVQEGKIRDQVINFQLKNNFKIIQVLPNYLPNDIPSGGNAAHMLWQNPDLDHGVAVSPQRGRLPDTVRISSIQYMQRRVTTFEEFIAQVKFFVETAADYKSDFVTFPELFSLQLLSLLKEKMSAEKSILEMEKFTDRIVTEMSHMAVRYNVNIIGGTHPKLDKNGVLKNIAYVLLRDGSIHTQEKIHVTPNEKIWWNMKGGDAVRAIQTDCGMIGVLICYDSEFPELARHLVDQGAIILFVPFSTDERQGYLRVRYCSHARAIENQCFVVLSGNVGNIPGVPNVDIHYGQSCILTPCDFYFSRDGVAADTTPNTEMVAFADLRYANLNTARNSGTVQNLKDRRFDLYAINWNDKNSSD